VTRRMVVIVAVVATGVLGLLWSQQRRLIYFPSPGPVPSATTVSVDARDVVLRTADGLELGAWYFPAPGGRPSPAVLVSNGNGGDRSGRVALAVSLRRLGMAVLLFDYRGYGGNPGRPSEEGLALDIRAAHDWLREQPDVDPARMVYFGESLGAAVALELVVERPPAALVLRSPFTSLADVARVHYPWLPARWLLLDRYPSIDRIGSLRAPLLIVAGDRDDIVPESQSRRLFDAAPEPKRYVLVPDAGHNDLTLLAGRQMIGAIEEFLAPILHTA